MEHYRPLDVMRRRLRETGVYKADGTTLVDAELAAYQAGLQPVLEAYETLWRELFVSTAESFGIENKEHLVGCAKGDVSLARRREMLLHHLSVGESDFTVRSLESALACVGITATIAEVPQEGKLRVVVTDLSGMAEPTQENARALAERFLPVHLAVEYDFSAVTI